MAKVTAGRWIGLLVGTFGGAALAISLGPLRSLGPLPAGPHHLPWLVLAAGFAAVEVFVIHVVRGRQTHTFSLVELPLVAGLYLASPLAVVTARLAGAGLALAWHRRQPLLKLAFNLAMFSLETSLALLVFRALVDDATATVSPGTWPAAFAAGLLMNVVSAVGVSTAIAVTSGSLSTATVRQVLVETMMIGPVANTSAGLCFAVLVWHEPAGALLMSVIAGVIVAAYRSYSKLRERYANLTSLYEFTQSMQDLVHQDDAAGSTLAAIARIMHAEAAGLFIALPGEPRLLRRIHPSDATAAELVDVGDAGPLWTRLAERDEPLLIEARTSDDLDVATLAALGWRDLVAVPFRHDDGLRGVLAVGNDIGDVGSFDREACSLFQALAGHAVVSFENQRLLTRLRHDALHDTLTGLPNRVLFGQSVEEALARRRPGQKVGVLLLDLDRFKDVNDTLGHVHGDRLLVEVGRRLTAALPATAVVARLGGDEFGILLPAETDAHSIRERARALGPALAEPFEVDHVVLGAEASIGIAVSPDHAEDAVGLLQRADVAMYAAKVSGEPEVYAANADDSRRRLTVITELRRALDGDELELWYQPQVDAGTGHVVCVEALLRWRHPDGLLLPGEFIPVAEHTGLMVPLTRFVIETAARQWRAWHDAGLDVGMAVNLSAKNLHEDDLAGTLRGILDANDMPAPALTVELTESDILDDWTRASASLDAVAASGIRVAVDDFGTGHSSFTRLRLLPVREIKIDKSFVRHMTYDSGDAAIVRSVIDLGRNLGHTVVAEGVESVEAAAQLAEWGCDRLQGYLLCKPAPAGQVTEWLAGSFAGEWPAPWLPDRPAVADV